MHKLVSSMTYNIIFGVITIVGLSGSAWLLHMHHLEFSQLGIFATSAVLFLWFISLISFYIHWMRTPKSFINS